MNLRHGMRGFGRLTMILSLVITIAVVEASAAFKYTAVGMEVRDFSGTDLISDNEISLGDLSKDNLVIVVFWATWSPRSLTQLSEMKALKAKYANHNVEIIAVNVDEPNVTQVTRIHIREIIQELDPDFPVIIDDGLDIFYNFGVIAVPSTAVVDTGGVLRYDPAGYGLLVRDLIEDSVKVFLGMGAGEIQTVHPPGYHPRPKASRYYYLALNLMKAGMRDQALANLDLAHESDTLFSAPLVLKGELLLQSGRFHEAELVFSDASAIDSTRVTVWAGWGRTQLRSGQTQSAREKLSHALTLDDTYTPALIDLGLCLARQDSVEAAIDSLLKASELNQGDPMIHYYLGQVYRQVGREQDAALAYLTALSIIYPEK